MATSFKKKTTFRERPSLPPGTKPSLSNNQLLISSGCPSLDILFGGGLAVGTLLMVEEDVHGSYASILNKLFIAEGVVCGQRLFLSSADKNPEDILKVIPKDTSEDKTRETVAKKSGHKDDLKIAWRYQNQPTVQSAITSSQCGHYFDLSETISEEKINTLKFSCFSPGNMICKNSPSPIKTYKRLLQSIKKGIENEKLYTENSVMIPNILRIQLSSLGSPLWSEALITSENYDPSLAWFLLSLRSLLRRSYSVAMVSVPSHLFEEKHFVKRIEHCCDVVIQLESFAGSEKSQNPLFNEYHGLFHVRKVPHINSICGENIDTSDLAFKVKRKKFLIEKLHLPPELSETVSRSSQSNPSPLKQGLPLCSMTTPVNNSLEF